MENKTSTNHENGNDTNRLLSAGIRQFKCVDRWQAESDYYHADWRMIEAKTRNEAKVKYSRLAHTNYIDVLCYACR